MWRLTSSRGTCSLMVGLWILFTANAEVQNRPWACQLACHETSTLLPHDTWLGSEAARRDLWSEFQARETPACRATPRSADDVGTILSVARLHSCRFSVLAGGTSAFQGASNSDGGITIDLSRMRHLEVYDDHEGRIIVESGAGNVWADVYTRLDSLGISAAGTRNSLTGITGSILGGGISFFSHHHGWTCDTVLEMEVVLANSTIVTVDESHNADLFWALKGGGNNFGIVTSVQIEAFRGPPEWYVFQIWDIMDSHAVFERLAIRTESMPEDVWQIAVTLAWHRPTREFVITERRVVSKDLPSSQPVGGDDTNRNDNVTTDVADELAINTYSYQRSVLQMSQKMDITNPAGKFNFFGSVTVANNPSLFGVLAEIFEEESLGILDAHGLEAFIVYNPLHQATIQKMKVRGGNALGIEVDDGPLMIVNINLRWISASENQRMRVFMQVLIRRFRAAAKSMGSLHQYIFQNHAFDEQDIFRSYGEKNLKRMHAIRKDVDPHGIFQLLQPGYFKLGMDNM